LSHGLLPFQSPWAASRVCPYPLSGYVERRADRYLKPKKSKLEKRICSLFAIRTFLSYFSKEVKAFANELTFLEYLY
jgi:hypothetical protein